MLYAFLIFLIADFIGYVILCSLLWNLYKKEVILYGDFIKIGTPNSFYREPIIMYFLVRLLGCTVAYIILTTAAGALGLSILSALLKN